MAGFDEAAPAMRPEASRPPQTRPVAGDQSGREMAT